ncbi:cytochrome b reductase 1 isoform X1 [Crotalus tigris]|uniref:cytochrome b reductase 1 isoform X1 n=1 Tax=Crotalus tigris TaxID=88082 RepID=UPI00192F8F42|nr:cytochrome b reductase 1 isoform X1 [Crotalus tigris]
MGPFCPVGAGFWQTDRRRQLSRPRLTLQPQKAVLWQASNLKRFASQRLQGLRWQVDEQLSRRWSWSWTFPRIRENLERIPAIIVYRLPWTWKCSKFLMKLIHAGLHTVALTLAIISLVAVFDFHNAKKIPNMYSLHSWIGLTAVILYALQLVLGLLVFLLPIASTSLRTIVMPIHVYSGLLLFGSVIATALMGITEKLFFTLKENPSYSSSPEEAIFVNVLGVLIVAYGAVILWMATRPHWKRPLEYIFQTHERIGEGLSDDDCHSPDLEFNSDAAARKRSPKSDEAGQRSAM